MANRRFTSQFNYSFERQLVTLCGQYEVTDVGAFASLVDNGITYTAVRMGAAGNSITVALVAGGTAGAEVVTVTGNAISVQIESGVSTRTQVKTAIDGSAAAAALVGVSVASGGTAATLMAATALASGDDTDFDVIGGYGMSLAQIGTGIFEMSLQDSYPALLGASIMLCRPSAAVDLQSQLSGVDVLSDQEVNFRMLAGATPTNLAVGDILVIKLSLRNSASQSNQA